MFETFSDFADKKIHFIGVNGVGVNALAKYCLDMGARVSGSDRRAGDFCRDLQRKGCKITEGEDAAAVDDADAVVYSSAINENNAELLRARERNIPVFERHEFLNIVAKSFDTVVGVAGSHGKTTVTAMLTHILKNQNANFVSMIGGDAINFSNYVNNTKGDGAKIFVTEACEYRRHMLSLDVSVASLLNVDWDHPDTYPTRESVEKAFKEYLDGADVKVFADGNFVAVKIGESCARFECETGNEARVYASGEFAGVFGKNLQGEYNQKNALFAVATAYALGIKPADSVKALASFSGVKRRYEKVGEVFKVPVVFDFAHHPTEIESLFERASAEGKILAVFQPHTYSRTRAYMNDFANVFANFGALGTLILLPTYAAREPKDASCDSDALMRKILSKNAKCDVYLAKDSISSVEFAKRLAKDYGIILFVGAGDIYDLRKYFQMQM